MAGEGAPAKGAIRGGGRDCGSGICRVEASARNSGLAGGGGRSGEPGLPGWTARATAGGASQGGCDRVSARAIPTGGEREFIKRNAVQYGSRGDRPKRERSDSRGATGLTLRSKPKRKSSASKIGEGLRRGAPGGLAQKSWVVPATRFTGTMKSYGEIRRGPKTR